MSLSKFFEIECFMLSKFDRRKSLNVFLKNICTKRPYVSFLDYVLVKVFRDRVFLAIKVRLIKMSKRLSKTICTKSSCISFLDYVFVKVFRDRVFRAIKVRLKKVCKHFSKNDLYYEILCFFSGLSLCQSISRSSVSCYQSSIKEIV